MWYQVVPFEEPARGRYRILANVFQLKEGLKSQPKESGDTTGPQKHLNPRLYCQESVFLLTSPSLFLSVCRPASYRSQALSLPTSARNKIYRSTTQKLPGKSDWLGLGQGPPLELSTVVRGQSKKRAAPMGTLWVGRGKEQFARRRKSLPRN